MFAKQLSAYVVVGIALTAVGYLAIMGLIVFGGVSPYRSNALVYLVGIVASYFLNAAYVFKDKVGASSFARFLISALFAYIATLLVLAIFLTILNISAWISQFMASVAYASVNFAISRFYVFSRKSQSPYLASRHDE